ncbi:hypothetical protein LTR85_009765 [Meristemomyces frigidus]|nr:hypothetical protein LTR85_009765 [Meristemomyces frigidus]
MSETERPPQSLASPAQHKALLDWANAQATHFTSIQEARNSEIRIPLGVAQDNWQLCTLQPKLLVLNTLSAFKGPYADLPAGEDPALKEQWGEWQDAKQKAIEEVLSCEEELHQGERIAWLFLGEVLDLHRKGFRPGAIVDTNMKCDARMNDCWRLLAAYPAVSYRLLCNMGLACFVAHPVKYAEQEVNDFLTHARKTLAKPEEGKGGSAIGTKDVNNEKEDGQRELAKNMSDEEKEDGQPELAKPVVAKGPGDTVMEEQ